MTEIRDNLIFIDEQKFFEIVHTTPDYFEAEDMLRGAKRAVLTIKERAVQRGDTRADQAMAQLLRKLNDEIHFISHRVTMTDWRTAVEMLWGKEGMDALRTQLVAMTAERKEWRKAA